MSNLTKLQIIRLNYLEKRRVFELMGANDLKDKLAIMNAYFFTHTLPAQFPAINARGA